MGKIHKNLRTAQKPSGIRVRGCPRLRAPCVTQMQKGEGGEGGERPTVKTTPPGQERWRRKRAATWAERSATVASSGRRRSQQRRRSLCARRRRRVLSNTSRSLTGDGDGAGSVAIGGAGGRGIWGFDVSLGGETGGGRKTLARSAGRTVAVF
jgi:hypothetical protein